jgi:hypothetical protein
MAAADGAHLSMGDCPFNSDAEHLCHMMLPEAVLSLSGHLTTCSMADSGNPSKRQFCQVCRSPIVYIDLPPSEALYLSRLEASMIVHLRAREGCLRETAQARLMVD